MAGKVLSARFVETVKPKSTRTEYPDAACPGLYLIVQPSGARSWALRYRRLQDRKSAKLTFDGGLSLAGARHAAAAARLRLEQGTDPAVKRLPAAAYDPQSGEAVEAVFASFLELHVKRNNRPSTARAAECIFNRIVLPRWRGRSVHSIRRRDVIDLVESVAVDRPYLANRALRVLSKFFNWLCARDVLAMSPVSGVDRPYRKEEVRTRTLDDAELRALWLACEGEEPFGQALQLLLLTGARRNEVSRMSWSEIDEKRRLWIIPKERTKNHREHVVPLSTQAWAIIDARPQLVGGDFVFSVDGVSPINGWHRARTRLSIKAGIRQESWRLHDVRRTTASGLQRLGVPVPVVEKALNHVSGTFRGIVSTYQTHDYADEVRIALQKWADYVEQLVAGKPARVLPLHGRRR
jgi:integrase